MSTGSNSILVFSPVFDDDYLDKILQHLQAKQLEAPMMCASPDFTQHDEAARMAGD
jgi:hypothetical protein